MIAAPLAAAAAILAVGATLASLAGPALAGLMLDRMIVDLEAGKPAREDVIVENEGPERLYVAIEPLRVHDPGQPGERRAGDPDPERLGMLVSPLKMVLEPGQRRVLRIAALGQEVDERVWRVSVKPVVGGVTADTTAIKIMVGYEILVVARPPDPKPAIQARREGRKLHLTNSGNASALLQNGESCDARGACVPMPAKPALCQGVLDGRPAEGRTRPQGRHRPRQGRAAELLTGPQSPSGRQVTTPRRTRRSAPGGTSAWNPQAPAPSIARRRRPPVSSTWK